MNDDAAVECDATDMSWLQCVFQCVIFREQFCGASVSRIQQVVPHIFMGHVTLDVSHTYSCEVIKATSANRNCTLTPRCRLAPMEVSSQKGGGGRDAALTIELLLLLAEPNGACFEEKSFSRSAAKRVPVSVSQCWLSISNEHNKEKKLKSEKDTPASRASRFPYRPNSLSRS